ncbi:kinase-like protein [Mytilinidion resinicola]|uniref:Kinase-like protein n=1 Tax=Mytilinidion resinicola TaxID=574789 RepID=A0A6A6YG80_9PEZI|nr:kinase-like protein [Mytilinidion resinicola]KAF2807024.1 kinase-like protein [Mytilinidion resinicola]
MEVALRPAPSGTIAHGTAVEASGASCEGSELQYSLEDITETDRRRFNTTQVLGHGAYAWVEEVQDLVKGDTVAMKVIPTLKRKREQTRKRVQEEVEILRKISGHCHIVRLRHAFAEKRGFCILVEPVAECDLAAFYEHCAAEKFPGKMIREIRMWFSCLAHGLEYIHSHRIRHKDIKPQNILVKDGNVLFADFGLAKDFASSDGLSSTTEGYTQKTPMYAAPEVHQQGERRYSADIFSLGCVFAELACLLSGEPVSAFYDFRVKPKPYGAETHSFHETLDLVDNWLEKSTLRIYHVIMDMLEEEASQRPTAAELQVLISQNFPDMLPCDHAQRESKRATTRPVRPGHYQVDPKRRSIIPWLPAESEPVTCVVAVDDQHSAAQFTVVESIKSSKVEYNNFNRKELFEQHLQRTKPLLIAESPSKPSIQTNKKVLSTPPKMTTSKVIVLLGAAGAGKSALVRSFTTGRFYQDYDPTIQDTACKPVTTRSLTTLLRMVDTAGQDEYAELRETSALDADGFVMVYSIEDRGSFERVSGLVEDVQRVWAWAQQKGRKDEGRLPRFLTVVGAKADLKGERCVRVEEGEKLAKSVGCRFLETSAKENWNVDVLFRDAVERLVEGSG